MSEKKKKSPKEVDRETDNMKGKVKSFSEGKYKSFGFIATDYGTDFYFNLAGMKDQRRLPKASDRVRFEPVEHENGPRAASIEILSGR